MASWADTFTGDGDLSGRSTTSGGKTWVVHSGTWATSGGKAGATATGGGLVYATVDSGSADVDYNITYSNVQNNGLALLFRYTDASNNWAVLNNGTIWKLTLTTSGSGFDDLNTYTAAASNGDVVRVVANGTGTGAILVYINGTLRITSSQFETFGGSAVKHGMLANFFTDTLFDDASLTDLNAGSGAAAPISRVRSFAKTRASNY